MTAGALARRLGLGLLAGLVSALALTTAQLVLRAAAGVPTPPELIPDRLAPTLTIDEFFGLIGRFGGYNELKQFGLAAVAGGQLAVGLLLGGLYGALSRPPTAEEGAAGARRRLSAATLQLVVAIGAIWLASLTLLWPNLGTSFVGLPSSAAVPVTAVGLLAGYAVYGIVMAWTFDRLAGHEHRRVPRPERSGGTAIGRRALLVGALGVALAGLSAALARRLWDVASFAYDGTRFWGPLTPLTPNPLFYVVTKNAIDPRIERRVWRLEIGGRVERPRTYGFEELAGLPAVVQETTLMCISNGVGDALMSNARWTGVPLHTLLDAAAPRPGSVEVVLHGADGYTDTILLVKALEPTTLVVFEMNGEPLPEIHGYPARVIVPGMYGEKNVKWVTRVEVVDHDAKGFYEKQGWGPDFVIPIRSRFYEPDPSQSIQAGAMITLRGIVFGGDRGISRAEVSLDDGQSWRGAKLEYPGTRLSWAIWRYDWRPERSGRYRLAVRGFDATGTEQPAEERGIVPSGARGYHRVEVTVAG